MAGINNFAGCDYFSKKKSQYVLHNKETGFVAFSKFVEAPGTPDVSDLIDTYLDGNFGGGFDILTPYYVGGPEGWPHIILHNHDDGGTFKHVRIVVEDNKAVGFEETNHQTGVGTWDCIHYFWHPEMCECMFLMWTRGNSGVSGFGENGSYSFEIVREGGDLEKVSPDDYWAAGFHTITPFFIYGYPHFLVARSDPSDLVITKVCEDGRGWNDVSIVGYPDNMSCPDFTISWSQNKRPLIFMYAQDSGEACLFRINKDGDRIKCVGTMNLGSYRFTMITPLQFKKQMYIMAHHPDNNEFMWFLVNEDMAVVREANWAVSCSAISSFVVPSDCEDESDWESDEGWFDSD